MMNKNNVESYLNLLELSLRGLQVYYYDLDILKIVARYLGGVDIEEIQ